MTIVLEILSNFVKVDTDSDWKVEVLSEPLWSHLFLKQLKVVNFQHRSFLPNTFLSNRREAKWLHCPRSIPSLHQVWHFCIAPLSVTPESLLSWFLAPGNADGSMMCWHGIASIIFEYIFWLEICSIKSGMEILPLGYKDAWGWDMGFCWNMIIFSHSVPTPPEK